MGNNFELRSTGEVYQNGARLTPLSGFHQINTNAMAGTSNLVVLSFSVRLSTTSDAEALFNDRPTSYDSVPANSEPVTFLVATKIEISNR